MLLHQPFGDRYGAYRALEEAYKAGKLRAIGVSNFYQDHLIDLAHNFEVKPTVNQVETHVFNQQVEASKYMAEISTVPMAWGSFAEGKNGIFTNDTLVGVGAKYGKTAAQVALRYLIQRGVIVIPKSSKKERMAQNIDVFDFKLSAEDMDAILKLDTGKPVVMPSHHDPFPRRVEGILITPSQDGKSDAQHQAGNAGNDVAVGTNGPYDDARHNQHGNCRHPAVQAHILLVDGFFVHRCLSDKFEFT